MRLSGDEARAIAFVGLLVALAVAARLRGGGEVASTDIAPADLDALQTDADSAAEVRARASRPLAAGERIDPNRAPAEELRRLPGIGPALAARIVAERESGGPFNSAADLARRVPGIGARTLDRLGPHLELPATAPAIATSPTIGAPRSGSAAARLDLNRASAADLVLVPGIGPVLAGRIIAYRDSAGPFLSIEELERVPGIGPASRARLSGHLYVHP